MVRPVEHGVMRRALKNITPSQMDEIYKEICQHHMMIRGRRIKYVETCFDARQGTIWYVKLRNGGSTVGEVFTTTNRFDTDGDINLFDEVMTWLKEGRGR